MSGFSLNSILSSLILLVMILVDYLHRYDTDTFQRRLYFSIIVSVIIAIVSDGIYTFFEGRPGKAVYYLLYVVNTLYFIFQITAYYVTVLFVDYVTNKNQERTKKIFYAVVVILVINAVILCFNFPRGYYFYISPENTYVYGDMYTLRLMISYLPAPILIVDLLISRKNIKRSQAYMLTFFALLTGSGAALDLILGSGHLIWPCLSAALLYMYFFIVRTDSKIDSLTGIDNRYSFNEFIKSLSGVNEKQAYSFVMIDLDEFKKINDTFGHLEGDNALRDTATILKGCVRHTDFAARYGGDEFILAARADSNIEVLLRRILDAVQAQNDKNTRPYKIKLSYGYDVFTPNRGQSIEEFLAHVDRLMYKQKAEKRGAP
jgi:diguanylate cyclase (GGDEF)-like protein